MIKHLLVLVGWIMSGSFAGPTSIWYALPPGFNQTKPDTILELVEQAPFAFDGVYIFGDSSCDTGNLFASSGNTDPDPRVYWKGRISNGPMWPDYLQAKHQFKIRSYAFHGAVVSKRNNVVLDVPDFYQQVQIHQNSSSIGAKKPLAIIQFVGNDLINLAITPSQVARDIGILMQSLIDLGEINDFALVQSPVLAYDAQGLNAALVTMINNLVSSNKAQIKTFSVVEIYTGMAKMAPVTADPSIWANLESHCYDTTTKQLCSDPQNHLYFDNYHPSTVPNYNIAMYISDAISSFWPL